MKTKRWKRFTETERMQLAHNINEIASVQTILLELQGVKLKPFRKALKRAVKATEKEIAACLKKEAKRAKKQAKRETKVDVVQ